MTASDRCWHEVWTLAPLVKWPDDYDWHLAMLDPTDFETSPLRVIASVVCDLRDRGQRIHWRRVRWRAQRRHPDGAAWVNTLVKAVGCAGSMDYWMGELKCLARKAA